MLALLSSSEAIICRFVEVGYASFVVQPVHLMYICGCSNGAPQFPLLITLLHKIYIYIYIIYNIPLPFFFYNVQA